MIKVVLTLIIGFLFGSLLIASQAFSWFRIQEMFHFDAFHMYGLLFSAIGTAAIGILIIKRGKIKTIHGNVPVIQPKPIQWKANIFGGLIFGLGWGISGACSAPVYVLVGLHWQIGLVLLGGALLGAFAYGAVHDRIPK